MDKEYDAWNTAKQDIDRQQITPIPHPREIWWCALGLNIGSEINGKGALFERPVLILKVFNKETVLVLPTTSRAKNDRFHFEIDVHGSKIWVKLSQIRVLSTKRLIRKSTATVPHEVFLRIRNELFKLL